MAIIGLVEGYKAIQSLLPAAEQTLNPDKIAQVAERAGAIVDWKRIEEPFSLTDAQIWARLNTSQTLPINQSVILFPHQLTNKNLVQESSFGDVNAVLVGFEHPVFDHDFILVAPLARTLLLFQDETDYAVYSWIHIKGEEKGTSLIIDSDMGI